MRFQSAVHTQTAFHAGPLCTIAHERLTAYVELESVFTLGAISFAGEFALITKAGTNMFAAM